MALRGADKGESEQPNNPDGLEPNMPLGICFYEDAKFNQFYPLTYLRPVFTMRAGIVSLFERYKRQFPDATVSFAARDQVAPLLAEQYRDYPVGLVKRGEGEMLFVNGRIRGYGDLLKLVSESRLTTVFKNGDDTVAVLFKRDSCASIPPLATPKDYLDRFLVERQDIPDFETTATVYHYPWEIMADIETEVTEDFKEVLRVHRPSGTNAFVHESAVLIDESNIVLDTDVHIGATAVLDASAGPIYIAANTRVEPQAAIYGPCYVGPNSVVVAGKITACSIGHTCRVGGEVEESIFHSYVNKYHAGFIGHSYVGSWVNFGAMTTNSDLKNNYSAIRVSVNGQMVDTGSIKVGSFIGDHTKFGIGTLLNTGINIGVCCNLFGGTLISDKEVASFSWGNSEKYDRYDLDKALGTAHKTAERRNYTLSSREISILESIFSGSVSSDGVLDF